MTHFCKSVFNPFVLQIVAKGVNKKENGNCNENKLHTFILSVLTTPAKSVDCYFYWFHI